VSTVGNSAIVRGRIRNFNTITWQNQKFLSIGSILFLQGKTKNNKRSETGVFPWVLVLSLGVCDDEGGWLAGCCCSGRSVAVRATEQGKRRQKTSLQSVSNSETDVTVNLTSFEELLVSRTTRKAQQNSWKDPSKNWGQNEGLRKAEEQENKGGNW